ncbi:MAG TPA: hypothetical protein VK466_05145 [Terriglobales bacterium]|nr:hypothetical protein [Terriglobales bacterium]
MMLKLGLFWGALLLLAACAPLTPEEQARQDVFLDIYWPSARGCVNRYPNVRIDNAQMNGDLSMSASADSRFDRLPFTECYYEAIAKRVAERRQRGQSVPDDIKMQPAVDFD